MPLGTKVGIGHAAMATLCYMGIQLPRKGAQPLILGTCLLWPNGRPCRLLLSTYYFFNAILDFQNVEMLAVGRVKTVEMCHLAKFRGDRSNCC